MTGKKPTPLLGYNTNVRHGGHLFHIQTEDSGVDHPHIITHLFVEGTILATKKQGYAEVLETPHWDERVRQMMKDQHRSMFIELRDGVHDGIAESILGPLTSPKPKVGGGKAADVEASAPSVSDRTTHIEAENPDAAEEKSGGVRVIRPAAMSEKKRAEEKSKVTVYRGRTIFDTPADNGEFGENLITDKSLDEVILSYLTDELDEP